jgi:hypothetical protein
MHNFFIAQTPGDSLAWLSLFFTHGNSYCHYNISEEHKDSYGIREHLMSRMEEYKGIADNLLPFYYHELASTLDTTRLVIVDSGEIKDARTKEKFENLKMYDHMPLSKDDLKDPMKMEELWYYCIPGIPFDRERYEMLFKMNVFKKVVADPRRKENIESIMRVS